MDCITEFAVAKLTKYGCYNYEKKFFANEVNKNKSHIQKISKNYCFAIARDYLYPLTYSVFFLLQKKSLHKN